MVIDYFAQSPNTYSSIKIDYYSSHYYYYCCRCYNLHPEQLILATKINPQAALRELTSGFWKVTLFMSQNKVALCIWK